MFWFTKKPAAVRAVAMIESMETRQLLSGSGLDDGGLHGGHHNGGAIHVEPNDDRGGTRASGRGGHGADDAANHDANDDRRARGADDATAGHNRRGRGTRRA